MRQGAIAVPGDKSITHRALLLAALTDGPCRITGALVAGDTRASAACLRALGVKVSPLKAGAEVVVQGGGLRPFRRPKARLDCANSGTTARLLMGLLAAHRFKATLTGDASLRRRPMARIADPLRVMGAKIALKDGRLPATIEGGALKPLDYTSPVASAQVKTAILFAGLAGGVRVSVTEPVRSRDHTERLLALLGVTCMSSGVFVALHPPASLPAFAGRVPGDISSAAYLLAARMLAAKGSLALPGVGVNPTRIGFIRAALRMGARIKMEAMRESLGEPVATLIARPAQLKALEVEPDEIPSMVDEVVLLACLAARAVGTSVFRGVGELRVKESDRLALVAKNLAGLGVKAHSEDDTLWVEGTDEPPVGRVETAGDHRLAMAFAVLGTVKGAKVTLDDRRCVAVSYPSFFTDLKRALRA
ncbi:MAG: 3-phosphoshikimate 1-carboxyvinyltransferase [Gemmatimonadales bacterium]